MDISKFKWMHEPGSWSITDGRIEINTSPNTDLWKTIDNAPMFMMETEEESFSFIAKADFTDSHFQYDQCGIVVYLGKGNWIKASVEFENEEFQNLGSVVTTGGNSDWATTAIDTKIKTMWYKVVRHEQNYRIYYSKDGKNFYQMRECSMQYSVGISVVPELVEGGVGIYACSPGESSFKAVFSDIEYHRNEK